MQRYIGTKIVNMQPMTRGEYNAFRGWTVPKDENPHDDGYLVEYQDSAPNTPYYAGYVSWSPSRQAESAYRVIEGGAQALSFGDVLVMMKQGKRVTRKAWFASGVFVYHVPAASYPVQTGAAKAHFGEGAMVSYLAYLAIKRADETVCVFVPGMDSMLADDWMIVD